MPHLALHIWKLTYSISIKTFINKVLETLRIVTQFHLYYIKNVFFFQKNTTSQQLANKLHHRPPKTHQPSLWPSHQSGHSPHLIFNKSIQTTPTDSTATVRVSSTLRRTRPTIPGRSISSVGITGSGKGQKTRSSC